MTFDIANVGLWFVVGVVSLQQLYHSFLTIEAKRKARKLLAEDPDFSSVRSRLVNLIEKMDVSDVDDPKVVNDLYNATREIESALEHLSKKERVLIEEGLRQRSHLGQRRFVADLIEFA